jgi:1,4-dihydroxy-2-naphthoyl-CoA hydrolase
LHHATDIPPELALSHFHPELGLGYWNERSKGFLPGLLGVEVVAVAPGTMRGRLSIAPHHLAPNGFLHAATVIGMADTLCGYGCLTNLPEGASGFTTIETKSNHLGTAREGAIVCEARLLHGGRMTQVWDAEVRDEATTKVIAAFRCTQMVLYPR